MTRLEFIETIKVLMPNLTIDDSTTFVKTDNIRIYWEEFSPVEVAGKIPYEVTQTIYHNYPCDKLDINAGIVGQISCPDMFLTDEIYKNELNKRIPEETSEQRMKRLNRAQKDLNFRPNEKKYLEKYRVRTKEGLIVIFKEIEAYYAKINKENLSSENDIMQTIATVNLNIINRINPSISSYAWIMQSMNAQEYKKGRDRENGNLALQEFRRAIDEFDRIVNPFMEQDLPIEEIVQDLKDKEISFAPFIHNKEYENAISYYVITISDTQTKNSVRFGINPAGFSYSSSLKLAENEFLFVRHFYSYEKKEENQGEIISIEYHGDNSSKKTIHYNITKGTISKTGEPKKVATDLQISDIYLDLIKASEIAANITINNLARNKDITNKKLSRI